jgi:anti-sigma regulatory factor (Ser/Thr protein kinase)
MEADPPYFLDGDEKPGPGLTVTRDFDTAVLEVSVDGRWSRRMNLDVYAVLRKCMAEHPSAVIIDLGGLNDPEAVSATMWVAAARAAAILRPRAQLVLSLPPTRQLASRLRRLGAVRFLPLFTTTGQARAAVATRMPLTDRLHLSELPPERSSIGTAGDLVSDACDAWELPAISATSRLVMAELAANAVEHAGTELAVTVFRRGTGIYLAVQDGDPRLPRLVDQHDSRSPDSHPPEGRGRGLWRVHHQASAWGARPAQDGKVVWAVMQPLRYGTAG